MTKLNLTVNIFFNYICRKYTVEPKLLSTTITVKKIEIIKRVSEINDEKIIDRINTILSTISPSDAELVEKYASKSNGKFSLQELIDKQGKKKFDVEKIDKLSKEANIQEPIEELIKMLD